MSAFIRVLNDVLPPREFQRLLRSVRAVGTERLGRTYQTTLWYDFGLPTNVVEELILALRPHLPRDRRIVGVEWWLSRMYTTEVQVDFHQDRDEKLALATGRLIHPRVSSVLFLNRVRGGALAITEALPDPEQLALAPESRDFTLVAPRPNRLVLFDGTLTHGVLDADNQIPHGRLPGRSRLRRTLVMNWWHRRPLDVPTYAEARVYPALRRGARSRPPGRRGG